MSKVERLIKELKADEDGGVIRIKFTVSKLFSKTELERLERDNPDLIGDMIYSRFSDGMIAAMRSLRGVLQDVLLRRSMHENVTSHNKGGEG